MRNNLNISIFGLGYVGLPLAIKLSNYFNVLGFDNNKQRIKELKSFLDKNNEVLHVHSHMPPNFLPKQAAAVGIEVDKKQIFIFPTSEKGSSIIENLVNVRH